MSLKNLIYFAAIGIVGGLVIGLSMIKGVSPIIAGLAGGLIILLTLLILNASGTMKGAIRKQ